MSLYSWIQFLAMAAAILLTAPFLGRYMASVYAGGKVVGDRVFTPVEDLIYKITRVNPKQEQRWTTYAISVIAFSVVSFLVLFAVQRLQSVLPFNPTDMEAVPTNVAFNVAVSFTTNTNWQAYGGESTMSHLTQMVGLSVQNFVSAAVGMSVMAALFRGLARRQANTIGNFWVDLTRTTLRVLIPLSLVVAILLISQGVIQNFAGFTWVETVEGARQAIPGGPAASQIAIKQLGTNGGGFFDMNSAHPMENANAISNFIQTWAIAIIPFATAFTFDRMVGDKRQGRAVAAIMGVILIGMSLGAMHAEGNGSPVLETMNVSQEITTENAGGGYLEGKEVRFGTGASGLWAAFTTGTSNGSVNSMHASMTPAGGGLALTSMLLGEVSPGGVGVGINGMLVMVILAVFIAGLMVGRTPEYLGKKIQAPEMKLVVLYIVAMPLVLLGFAAISAVTQGILDASLSAPQTGQGAGHGLSEILYGFASAANNNGSAFAGLGSDTNWFTITQGLAMLVGRFFLIIPVLAIAGSMARKRALPETSGTFPPHTPLFSGLVVGVVLIVAGLTFLPALALGPILEHFTLFS